jgi:transposase
MPSPTADAPAPEPAPATGSVTVKESETVMPVQPTDPWKVIARPSRRADAFARQVPRRAAENALRQRAATVCDELAAGGQRCGGVAKRLHLTRRTLTRWRRRRAMPPGALLRGRPRKESPHEKRYAVLQFLEREGRHIGLPTLRSEFPEMPRCELRELQVAYRRQYRATHRRSTQRLTWHGPGRVWAMDHVDPPHPIDGVDRAVFAVRDLASGMQLAWHPVRNQTEPPVHAVLESLFQEHDPPLLIKKRQRLGFQERGTPEVAGQVWYHLAPVPSPDTVVQWRL